MRKTWLTTLAIWAAALPGPATAQDDRAVILVRHAEKGEAPRADPSLTDAGRARANALAAVLEHARLDAAFVTQFRRTRETAEPAARARGLDLVVVGVTGGLEAHVQAVADSVRMRLAGEIVLVVGHSNTIPAIIAALGGPRLPDLCDAEYATLFTLLLPATGRARLVRSTYGAPDPEAARTCGGAS